MRRNAEVHHFDLLGTAGVITGAGGAVVSSALFDAFGVARFAAGHAATPWRWMRTGEEGLVSSGDGEYLPRVAVWLRRRQRPSGPGFAGPIRAWIEPARTDQERCLQGCHQRATEQAWRCRKPIRAALRRRGGSRLRRLLELSVLPCLAGVYADFMLCYMACKTEHLY